MAVSGVSHMGFPGGICGRWLSAPCRPLKAVKTIIVRLTNPGHEALATLRYEAETWPNPLNGAEISAHSTPPDGTPVKLACSLGWLEGSCQMKPHE